MLRALTLAAFLLITLLWTMAVAVTGRAIAAPESADTAATVAVTSTGVITVTTTDDEVNIDGDCSLREAIQAADTNAVVDGCSSDSGGETIYVPAGLYQLSLGQLEVTGAVTLKGSQTDATILDGGGANRILYIDAGAKVTLQRLEIRNGLGTCPSCEEFYYDGTGGGITNYGASLIIESTIDNNRSGYVTFTPYDFAGADGGGIYNRGILTVTSSTISGNAAGDGNPSGTGHNGEIYSLGGQGGGIANFGTLTIDNSTVTNNQGGKGGGPSADGNSLIYGAGGLYRDASASVTIKNSIIAGNQGYDCNGTVTSLGYNLFQTNRGCTPQSEVMTDRHWQAYLDPLRDNGGPTLTHALGKKSPAIDAGNCTDSTGITVTVDQRGEPRPQGDGCDIGAYESPYTSTFAITNTSLPLIGR